ncbi:MAG TPA: response regulator [Geobacteraceae bacterium]
MVLSRRNRSKISLLYVEDSPVAREMLGSVITMKFPGVELRLAENGKAGLESFREAGADIVLSDVSMPVMSGIEMAKEIRTLDVTVPIILLTAHNDTQFLIDAIRAGVNRYVMKPVEHSQLFEAINEGISRVNLERQVKEQQEELLLAKEELEHRVEERTAELARTVEALQTEALERREAERDLMASERKFRSIFEDSKDAIFIMGADGRVRDVNPAGCEILGYSREEILNVDAASLYCSPGERECYRRKLYDKGYVKDYELKLRKKSGDELYILATAAVIRDERGEIVGDQGIAHDITERRRLEQQLLQSQKMESVGLLAGGVAHDFNNLMTAVLGYSQILKENLPAGDDMAGSCLDQVIAAAGRATELTRNLLAFSRKQIINPKPVQVNDIIINLAKLLTRVIGEDIELTTSLASRHLVVMADSGQIDQVLINLATNARDAMPGGGKLRITTQRVELGDEEAKRLALDAGGGYATISVRDSGTGMNAATKERIFEPFFTTKEVGKGTGLGLSIIYGIVKQHNGTVTVESEPGKGATFTVYLPLYAAALPVVDAEVELPPPCGTETLLVAEDDMMVRTYVKKLLELAGYNVITAQNGEDALEQFRENRHGIALVLCDVVMPRMNGREVFDEARRMMPQVKFIFMSGYNDEIIHNKGVLEGGIDFLMKPLERRDLLKKVREVLDRE